MITCSSLIYQESYKDIDYACVLCCCWILTHPLPALTLEARQKIMKLRCILHGPETLSQPVQYKQVSKVSGVWNVHTASILIHLHQQRLLGPRLSSLPVIGYVFCIELCSSTSRVLLVSFWLF